MWSPGRGCTAVGTTFISLTVWPACAEPTCAALGGSLQPMTALLVVDREPPAALAEVHCCAILKAPTLSCRWWPQGGQ